MPRFIIHARLAKIRPVITCSKNFKGLDADVGVKAYPPPRNFVLVRKLKIFILADERCLDSNTLMIIKILSKMWWNRNLGQGIVP